MKKNRMQIISYVIGAIFLAAGLYYMVRSQGHCCEMTEHAYFEIKNFYYAKKLNGAEKKVYSDKMKFHNDSAVIHFALARDKCWYLPNIPDRDKARACLISAFAVVGAPTPQSKIIASLTSLLVTYGLSAIDEWHCINDNLYQAQYHFEMAEFYQGVLEKY